MKRFFSIMLIFLLTFTSIFSSVPFASAESVDDPVYADGEYTLPFEVWKADQDSKSVAADYLVTPAKLIVENGVYTVEATLKNDSWWQYFKVASGSDFVDVQKVSTNEEADTSVVRFNVEDLTTILDAKIHVIVTGIPGFTYDNKYDIRFKFDPSGIPFAPEPTPEEPTEPEQEPATPTEPGGTEDDPAGPVEEPGNPNEEPTETEDPVDSEQPATEEPQDETAAKYADGEYVLPFVVWKADQDGASVADGYLEKPAKLIVENGVYTVEATLKNDSWWQYFKVASGDDFVDVEKVSTDAGKDTSVVRFNVEDLTSVLDAKIHVIVTGIPGFTYDNKYDIRFKFDPSEIPFASEEEPEGETPGTEEPTDPAEENPGSEDPQDKDDEEIAKYKDGEYELPFDVLKADQDVVSVANSYLEQPGKLIVKNGVYTVEATLKNDSWWQYFKVASGDDFVDVEKVSTDAEKDTSVVRFNVEDLTSVLDAKIHVIVTGIPGFTYDNKYDIRFKFDPSGIPFASEEETPGTEDPEDPEIPVLDITDGDYTIEFDALHATEDKASAMARYLEKVAQLSVKEGKTLLTLTVKDHKTVTGFQVENNGELVEPIDQIIDEAANTREIIFDLEELASIVNARVQYTAGAHSGDQPLRLSFNDESLTEVVKEEPEEETPGTEDPTDPEIPVLDIADGDYTIELSALHATEDKPSGMASYLKESAFLSVKEGKTFLTLTLNKQATITGFQVENNGELIQPIKEVINEETNTREIEFELDELASIINARVQYTVGAHVGDQPLRLSFDEASLTKVIPVIELANGDYTIELSALHATEDKPSGMASYLKESAFLSVKEGKTFLTLTLNKQATITGFQVENNGELIQPIKEVINEETNTREIEFELDELASIINARVQYTVGAHAGDQPLRLSFNEGSLTEVVKEEPQEEPELEEGKLYSVNLKIEGIDEETREIIENHLNKDVLVSLKDGVRNVTLTLENQDKIESIQYEVDGEFVEAKVVDTNEELNTRTVSLTVDKLTSNVKVKLRIANNAAPQLFSLLAFNLLSNDTNEYEFNLSFDVETMKETDPAEETPGNEDPQDEDEKTLGKYKDGEYELPFAVWQADKDDKSVAADYLVSPAKLVIENGEYTVEATLKNASWWQYFKVASGEDFIDVTEVSRDGATDTSVVQFKVNELDQILQAKIHVIVTGIPGFTYDNKYDIRLKFDTSGLPLTAEDPTEETPGTEDPTDPKEETPGTEDPTELEEEKPGTEDPQGKEEEKELAKYKAGVYELPFVVWQADKDEVSVADSYLEKPAKLIIENGVYTIETTLKNSSWWQYFKVASGEGFIDVTEVSKDAATDTSVVRFTVQDLDEILQAKIHVIVTGIPGFTYDNKYDIRFKFDTSALPLSDGSKGENNNGKSENGNNNGQNGGNNNDDDQLPNFDRNKDGNVTTDQNNKNSENKGNTNPKTADTGKIFLFTLLLVGSLIPLAMRMRKKFVSN
ncbi:NEAT domain-containing protein [Bacillus sp. FJAT-50079]|uniref:NEAT domain-containing protein n=1 Tax=Bacillus sp. FJAT-50079 TaxID=2833577 RepID=UPI001BC8D48D|nr:NEAT domain-containing protein [Bacillus sp. FJAT-50079]MBS4207897.1 NEAT domain-containing protein [Bacillus sp. FJAT-50079]